MNCTLLRMTFPEHQWAFEIGSTEDQCVARLYDTNKKPENKGAVLFHFFQKMLQKQGESLFTHPDLQSFATRVHRELNSRELASGIRTQLAGANKHFQELIEKEKGKNEKAKQEMAAAQKKEKEAVTLDPVKGDLYQESVGLPHELSALVVDYLRVDKKMQKDIEDKLKAYIVAPDAKAADEKMDEVHDALIGYGADTAKCFDTLDLSNTNFFPEGRTLQEMEDRIRTIVSLFSNLKRLHLAHCGLFLDGTLFSSQHLPLLEELNVAGNYNFYPQPDRPGAPILRFQALQRLVVDTSGYNDDYVGKILPDAPNLRSLSIRDSNLNDPITHLCVAFRGLTHLDVGGSLTLDITAFEGKLELLPHLQELTITGITQIKQAEVNRLRARYPNIRIIY